MLDEKEGQTNYCPQCEELQAQVTRLRENLTALVDHYTSLVNSGDAGSWNPEKETEIINSRAALSDASDNDKWLAQVKAKTLEDAKADNGRGFSLWFSREEWGGIIDGLVLEIERSGGRKKTNSESTSDVRMTMCERIIAVINNASELRNQAKKG